MRNRQALLLPSLITAFAAVLPAQQAGPAPAPPPTSGNTQRPRNPSSTQPNNNGADTSFPVFLSGTVMTGDGSALPQNISIVRICANSRRTLGYTDSKGHFNVRVSGGGPSSGAFPDASESSRPDDSTPQGGFGSDPFSRGGGNGQLSSNPLMGCELEAYAPGFRSPNVDLTNHRNLDNPDVGTIVLQRIAGVEGTSISATSYNAPKAAQNALKKGEQLLQKSKPDEAIKEFGKATALYPKYAVAWLYMGRAQVKLKDDPGARDSFEKALDAEPKLVDAWGELGLVHLRAKNWVEASQDLDRALKLNPVEYPSLWFFDAVANFNGKNYEAAEKSAREAVKVDVRHENPKADQILGLTLFQKRDLPGAVDSLRSYLKYAKDAPDAGQVQAQIAELENILAAK